MGGGDQLRTQTDKESTDFFYISWTQLRIFGLFKICIECMQIQKFCDPQILDMVTSGTR